MHGFSSLRARLLWYLLAAIVVTVSAQALIAYRTALAEANEIFDYQMEQTALSLRHGMPQTEPKVRVPPPASDRDDDFFVQIWSRDGTAVFTSIELPTLPHRAPLGYSQVKVQDTLYRVFVAESDSHVIQVSQDLSVRRDMARTLALRTTIPVAFVAPLLMLAVWWTVSASLSPVARVREQISSRQVDDLSEIGAAGLPDEVRPLIEELNLLFRRLRRAFDAQDNFVADAAHELRSPLAALKLQIQALHRTHDADARERAMARLSAGIERATRLVEQLLALARQQAHPAAGIEAKPVALLDLARQELVDATPAARAREVDLGLADSDDVRLDGYPDALRMLVRNLLDNAIKHTPPGGTIDVTVRRDGPGSVLRVEDSGSGIPPAEQHRVLDRFYRAAGNESSGSGLGLAIVKAVADLHGASLRFGASARLGGLQVDIVFGGTTPSGTKA